MGDDFEVPEKPRDQKERAVGLIIAAIAVVLAIVTSLVHQTHNEEIVAHVDAADQFSFFQAKKARHQQLELTLDNLHLLYDRLSPAAQPEADRQIAADEKQRARLDDEEKEIEQKGKELMAESHKLAAKAHVLDLGEIALQIAVVLCSITILTEQFLFVRLGVGIALLGVLIAAGALIF